MSDRTERYGPEEQLVRDATELARAGDTLAIAAARVCAEYDGIHRLRLALAEWYQARANEGGRDFHAAAGEPEHCPVIEDEVWEGDPLYGTWFIREDHPTTGEQDANKKGPANA